MGTTVFSTYVNNNTDYTVGSEVFSASRVGIYGTPVSNQVGVWKTASTIEGDTDLTFDGTTLTTTGLSTTNTQYLSIPAVSFQASEPDTATITFHATHSYLVADSDGIVLLAPVNLPNGATVTGAVVYGNAAAIAGETYTLRRMAFSNGQSGALATASIGTIDTTIANAVIDNTSYGYYFQTSSIDTNDAIYGARISYTGATY